MVRIESITWLLEIGKKDGMILMDLIREILLIILESIKEERNDVIIKKLNELHSLILTIVNRFLS